MRNIFSYWRLIGLALAISIASGCIVRAPGHEYGRDRHEHHRHH